LPLRVSELRRVGQLASTLSGQLIHVDSQIFISSTRASCFLRAGSATFGAANVSVSTIANIQPNVVELFPSRTAIAVAFWLIGKTLRSVEGAVLALRTLSRPHVSGDFPLCQPLQKLSVPVRRVGRHRFWRSSLPLRETGEHDLRGSQFRPGGLHPILPVTAGNSVSHASSTNSDIWGRRQRQISVSAFLIVSSSPIVWSLDQNPLSLWQSRDHIRR
jgi:hypothetical protein